MDVPFVGREEILIKLNDYLKTAKCIVVHGLKSIGKTRTVSEFLSKRLNAVPHQEAIEISLTEGNIPKQIFLGIATSLGIDLRIFDDWNICYVSVTTAFNIRTDAEFIITIDNCEHIFEGSIFLQTWFKHFRHRLINETSNVRNIILTSVLPDNLIEDTVLAEIKPLSMLESCQLLRLFMSKDFDSNAVSKVAELCLGLPLALIIVGAELRDNSLEDITEFLMHSRIQALSSEFYPAMDRVDFNYGLLIKRLAPTLRDHLAALQYIPGSFSKQQAEGIIGTDSSATLLNLSNRHILSTESCNPDRLNIHGILRDCINMFLVIKDIRGVKMRFCKAYSNVMKDISSRMNKSDYIQAIKSFVTEYPNLEKLLQEVNFATSDTFHVFIDIVTSSADLLHNYMGRESVPFYMQCLKLIPLYGTKIDEAILRWGYGEVLTYEKGLLSEGENSYKTALNMIHDVPLSPLHVQIRSSFGICLWRSGKQSISLCELNKALDDASYLGLKNEPIMTTCIRNLAVAQAYYNFQNGEKYHKEALKRTIEYHQSEKNAYVANSLNGLGICFQGQGKNDIALEYFEKALELKRSCNVAVKSLILTINNVAMRYSFNGQKGEACRLLQEALMLLERCKSDCMHSRLATYENYGCLQLSQNNYEVALSYIDKVITIRRLHSPLSPNIFEMFELKGIICMYFKLYDEACSYFEQVIEKRRVIFEQRPLNVLVYFCYIRLLECYALLKDKTNFIETYKHTKAELKRLITEREKIMDVCVLLDSIPSLKTKLVSTLTKLNTVISEWDFHVDNEVVMLGGKILDCDAVEWVSAREQSLK